jgi:hypothetical protein
MIIDVIYMGSNKNKYCNIDLLPIIQQIEGNYVNYKSSRPCWSSSTTGLYFFTHGDSMELSASLRIYQLRSYPKIFQHFKKPEASLSLKDVTSPSSVTVEVITMHYKHCMCIYYNIQNTHCNSGFQTLSMFPLMMVCKD